MVMTNAAFVVFSRLMDLSARHNDALTTSTTTTSLTSHRGVTSSQNNHHHNNQHTRMRSMSSSPPNSQHHHRNHGNRPTGIPVVYRKSSMDRTTISSGGSVGVDRHGYQSPTQPPPPYDQHMKHGKLTSATASSSVVTSSSSSNHNGRFSIDQPNAGKHLNKQPTAAAAS